METPRFYFYACRLAFIIFYHVGVKYIKNLAKKLDKSMILTLAGLFISEKKQITKLFFCIYFRL